MAVIRTASTAITTDALSSSAAPTSTVTSATSVATSSSAASPAAEPITLVYAQVTFAAGGPRPFSVTALETHPASIINYPSSIVTFTAENDGQYEPSSSLVVNLRATIAASTFIAGQQVANIVFFTPPTAAGSTDYLPSTTSNIALALTDPAAGGTTSSNPTASASATGSGTATSGTTEPSEPGTTSAAPGDSTPYGAGALAGAAVGCALGGILLTALIFFLLFRKRLSRKQQSSRSPENGQPLLRGHGEAVYVPGGTGTGWEKQLPQADADSTIKSMTNRTLDQIAMHVENYYTSKGNVALGTEHEFELETIDSSPISEPISTVLRRHDRVEELIKHYMSGYIISMIDFEGSGRSGNFLPKAFRKQWQPASEDTPAFSQAYSRWRVVTAYLRQTSDDEQAYIAERDSIISTAARHVCKAFEPWAKADERTRLQNIIGIMTRASELGVQLFSQPARFEWQWLATSGDRSGSSLVILPGLYKTTDQQSMPLTQPLHLVEPSVVRF